MAFPRISNISTRVFLRPTGRVPFNHAESSAVCSSEFQGHHQHLVRKGGGSSSPLFQCLRATASVSSVGSSKAPFHYTAPGGDGAQNLNLTGHDEVRGRRRKFRRTHDRGLFGRPRKATFWVTSQAKKCGRVQKGKGGAPWAAPAGTTVQAAGGLFAGAAPAAWLSRPHNFVFFQFFDTIACLLAPPFRPRRGTLRGLSQRARLIPKTPQNSALPGIIVRREAGKRERDFNVGATDE